MTTSGRASSTAFGVIHRSAVGDWRGPTGSASLINRGDGCLWLGVGVSRASDAVGAYGERVAARALTDAGMRLLDRNWRSTTGEIDLVAIDAGTIVFCEVKTRRGEEFGAPAEAVNPAKVRKLRALASMWLTAHPDTRGEVRFDVVSVWPQPSGPAIVEHSRGAF